MERKTHIMATEVPEELAQRFRAACRADERSISGGLRRLVREYLGDFDTPEHANGAAANGAAHETSKTAPAEGDLVSPV